MPPPLHSETTLPTAPHPVRLKPDHLPPGEGESQKGRQPSTISNRTPPQSPLATAPPAQGSLFLCSVSPYVDFYRAVIASKRAGRAAAPTRKIDTASRPSSGHFVATFPQGKAFFPPPGNSALSYPKFSAIPRKMHGNPPFGGFSFLDSYCIMEEKIQEVRLCPHLLFI